MLPHVRPGLSLEEHLRHVNASRRVIFSLLPERLPPREGATAMHLARYQDTVATAQALLEHGIEWTPALARDFERAHQWSLEHQGRAIPPGSRTRTREMKAWARAVRSLIKRRQERSVSPEMVEQTLDYINESLQQLLGLRNYHFYQTARGKFTTMVQAAIRRSP